MRATIPYGSQTERFLLAGAFALAGSLSALLLYKQGLFLLPYLALPGYLAMSCIVLLLLPQGWRKRASCWRCLGRFLPAGLLMGAIYQASSLSFPPSTSMSLPDVFFHGLEFFGLGLLTARMTSPEMAQSLSTRPFLLSLSLVLASGVLDEAHQYFVPGRDPSCQDFLWDACGGLVGILTYRFLFTFREPLAEAGDGKPGWEARSADRNP